MFFDSSFLCFESKTLIFFVKILHRELFTLYLSFSFFIVDIEPSMQGFLSRIGFGAIILTMIIVLQ